MPRSMTGQGQARQSGEFGLISVELRTVNNRGLKLTTRLDETLGGLEARVEALLRRRLHRGSVQCRAGRERTDQASRYEIDASVVKGYYQQLDKLHGELYAAAPIDLTQLALLPGAVRERDAEEDDQQALWSELQTVLEAAIENLNEMRDQEGQAMQGSLEADCRTIAQHLQGIVARSPQVVAAYRDRLQSRVDAYLAEKGLEVAQLDILREVQLFVDRSDISEEATRLEAHLDAFTAHLGAPGANGRKLDFVIQEMFRETNTIGSKASDSEISAHVVEMKCALERMRELAQNIE
ncbi:YicC/YloC family endoribonuclease [Roseimaritima sediminicola]|uniref:YicC/YloC family endoribonuclease n=1 Tax=Roseimaritima sediminicola TaxID=2662066 RepID=UPI0012983C16|nr:YicC/YloC family endoribonuclease [Roseimaritima sediminicola]